MKKKLDLSAWRWDHSWTPFAGDTPAQKRTTWSRSEKIPAWLDNDRYSVDRVTVYRHSYRVGDPVVVNAFGRWREGVVTKLGRTQIEVDYARNRSGSRSSRSFSALQAWPWDCQPLGDAEGWPIPSCRHGKEVEL